MTCHHICQCGAELSCMAPPDQCAAGKIWVCPNCEDEDFARWVDLQATIRSINGQLAQFLANADTTTDKDTTP